MEHCNIFTLIPIHLFVLWPRTKPMIHWAVNFYVVQVYETFTSKLPNRTIKQARKAKQEHFRVYTLLRPHWVFHTLCYSVSVDLNTLWSWRVLSAHPRKRNSLFRRLCGDSRPTLHGFLFFLWVSQDGSTEGWRRYGSDSLASMLWLVFLISIIFCWTWASFPISYCRYASV